PSADRRRIAGTKCTDQQRNEQPIQRMSNRFARVVSRLSFGGIDVGYSSFGLSLIQACFRCDQLGEITLVPRDSSGCLSELARMSPASFRTEASARSVVRSVRNKE